MSYTPIPVDLTITKITPPLDLQNGVLELASGGDIVIPDPRGQYVIQWRFSIASGVKTDKVFTANSVTFKYTPDGPAIGWAGGKLFDRMRAENLEVDVYLDTRHWPEDEQGNPRTIHYRVWFNDVGNVDGKYGVIQGSDASPDPTMKVKTGGGILPGTW